MCVSKNVTSLPHSMGQPHYVVEHSKQQKLPIFLEATDLVPSEILTRESDAIPESFQAQAAHCIPSV